MGLEDNPVFICDFKNLVAARDSEGEPMKAFLAVIGYSYMMSPKIVIAYLPTKSSRQYLM